MDRRVVITGLGVITPVGNDVTTFWNNLINGVCGIDFIKRFPTDNLQIKIAGEVKDFNPASDGVPAATIRKADRFTLFAMAAANQAMKDAAKAIVCSTKSMTGHILGAAGGAEVVAAVLALRDGIVPPTIGLQEPDPDCDLDYTPGKARKAEITMALSSSLGFGGHNAVVALRKI